MVQLHQAQSILTVGPTRDADPRDYSILRLDMPHRDNANPDAPHKRHRLTYSPRASTQDLSSLSRIGNHGSVSVWVSLPQPWPLMLTRSVHAIGSDSTPTTLHTCSMHSGNWYCAHELVLSAVADIAHAAGFRTNRGSRVPNSRGQRRGDLEIKGLNVAGTTDLTAFEVLRTMNTPCHLTGGPAVPDQLPTGISISMIVGMHKLRF